MWLTKLFASSPNASGRLRARRPRSTRRLRTAVLAVEPLEDRCLLSASFVKDINPFSVGSNPQNLTDVDGTLFFTANDGSGPELWKTDGTAAGTVLVKALATTSPSPTNFTNVNG